MVTGKCVHKTVFYFPQYLFGNLKESGWRGVSGSVGTFELKARTIEAVLASMLNHWVSTHCIAQAHKWPPATLMQPETEILP